MAKNYKKSIYNTVINASDDSKILLMNSLYRNADFINKDIQEKLKKDLNLLDTEAIEYMAKRKYIIPDDIDEYSTVENMTKEHINNISKMGGHYVIAPTLSCNMRCSYCFQAHELHEKIKVMDKKRIDKIFEWIDLNEKENNRNTQPKIMLFGGEPFQNIKEVKDSTIYVLNKIYENKYMVQIVTNGYDLIHYIPYLENDYITQLQITIDGPPSIHNLRRKHFNDTDSFSKIEKGIDLALKKGLNIRVRVNIDSETLKHIVELMQFVIKRRWLEFKNFSIYTGYVQEYGSNYDTGKSFPKLVEEFYKLRKDNEELLHLGHEGCGWAKLLVNLKNNAILPEHTMSYCGASNNMLCFSADDYLYACTDAMGDKNLSIGKYYPNFFINDDQLQIWRTQKFNSASLCTTCKVNLMCGGGCTFKAIRDNGAYNLTSCEELIQTVSLLLPYYEDM